ncbi:MAG: endonuclease III [Ignavibacteria bacterium]|nr:endonuclease III [Ignavibacteria bacterium]
MKIKENTKKKIKLIIDRLSKSYPDAKVHLIFNSAFELLISTILSAQCTDELVNKVMVPLYKEKYKSPQDILNDGLDKFKDNIKSINFYNNKAKSILKLCEILVEKYNGNIPDTMEELTKLPGIGRKSANVILGNYFGKKDTIIVDTHFKRVATRLGLTENENPDKIEFELKEVVPSDEQYNFSTRLGEHGRQICKAKNPKCIDCIFNDICPSVYK